MSSSLFGPFLLLFFILVIGGLLVAIFFNLTLQRSMAAVSERNRTILPGLIWLNFIPIPFLNSIWSMIFGIMTCNAMNKEAGKKIAPSTLAVVYPSLLILASILWMVMNGFFRSRSPNEILALGFGLMSLITLVLWIIFWVQLNSAKNKLKTMTVTSNDGESLDSGFVDDEF